MEDEFEMNPNEEEGFQTLDDTQQFQQQEEDTFAVSSEPPQMPRRTSSDAPMPTPPASEATNKWKSENEKKVKARDAENAKAKAELTKKAEATLEKFRVEREAKIAKAAKANREAQAKALAAVSSKSTSSDGISWKKLSVLVDLDKETTDKERMRLLFKAKVVESKA